jgi:hypothetical protein
MNNQVLLLIPFTLIAGGGFAIVIRDFLRGRASENWPTVTGEVIESKVIIPTGSRGTYAPRVSYRYQINGVTLIGNRISFASISRKPFLGMAERVGESYHVSQSVQVSVSPVDPGQSVLEPGAKPSTYLLLLGFGGFLVIGIWKLAGSLGMTFPW